MTTRDRAPIGAPCWADLSTSDVEGSRTFYAELFGWKSEEPSEEFGGYFMFTRNGVPVAGGMGGMGEDMPATDTWKIYLATEDIEQTATAAVAGGGQILAPSMPVADLGVQLVLIDPTGATLGAWQPLSFPGFTVMNEHGAPSWYELFTRDHAAAVDFYRSVFHWETTTGDSDEFRYTTMQDPSAEGDLAGIMDASAWLPQGAPASWSIYWEVDDADTTVAKVKDLGGSLVAEPEDTPYGRLATVADPAGAQFKLRTVTS